MADDVAFEQRRERPLALTAVEIRLGEETYALEMTVTDAGGVYILSFGLESKPRGL